MPAWQISLPFHMLQLMKSLPYYIPEAWKRFPFQAEPPHIGHYREYPSPPGIKKVLGSNVIEARISFKLDYL